MLIIEACIELQLVPSIHPILPDNSETDPLLGWQDDVTKHIGCADYV